MGINSLNQVNPTQIAAQNAINKTNRKTKHGNIESHVHNHLR